MSVNLSREWQYSGDGWNQIVNVENVVTGGKCLSSSRVTTSVTLLSLVPVTTGLR